MSDLSEARTLLSDANKVLVAKGVLDAYGHVSMRNPENPQEYLLARNLAPALVKPEDIIIYRLDSDTQDPRTGYLERFIHGEIYAARPDVHAVVHSHSASVIPFSISEVPLRAVWHMAGFLGTKTAVFEMRNFAGDASDLIIGDRKLGEALSHVLSASAVVLMRGHGSVAVGENVEQAVWRSVFTELNARVQLAAHGLGSYMELTEAEGVATAEMNAGQIRRAWEIWRSEVTSLGASR